MFLVCVMDLNVMIVFIGGICIFCVVEVDWWLMKYGSNFIV